jgi:hypothetical protein
MNTSTAVTMAKFQGLGEIALTALMVVMGTALWVRHRRMAALAIRVEAMEAAEAA